MKHICITLTAAILIAAFGLCETASAQSNSLINHTIVKTRNTPPFEGRDFWLVEQSNQWGEDLGGKYIRIYITSPSNCTAIVESNGNRATVSVQANKQSSFAVPEFWEMESSGIVEPKAIHVYCTTADLSVYNLSHSAYGSEGEYVIPTIGWGTDYVVAAYESLYEGTDFNYDFPSTMAVVSDQDNTILTITPSCDCRQSTGGNDAGDANSTIMVYPSGVPAQFQLNRGQSLQLMPVKATDAVGFDMSGTIVQANQPVGVFGGSQLAEIPSGTPYPEHVEDMMPPVRTWGETYYATSWNQSPGRENHEFARYLFISSQPNQTIYRHDFSTGDHTECVITNQYGTYWDEFQYGQKFTSNAPFLVVSYINSSTYPDGTGGLGNPAECIINPKDHYSRTVVCEVPTPVGNIVPYNSYANLICRDSDARYTIFDGNGILGLGAEPIDDTFEVFIVNIGPGTHTVVQDTTRDPNAAGAGLYIYGYGSDESYAWTGSFGTGTFHSLDTVAPKEYIKGECYSAYVHVSDSGLLPDGLNHQSGLGEIRLDSSYNMRFVPDPGFTEGSGYDTSDYSMFVVDPTKPAILVVEVYDIAGNETKITSVYEPLDFSIVPPLQNLGVWHSGVPPNVAYDTLFNLGEVPLTLTELHLLYGNVGFSIYDSIGGPPDLSPLQPGQHRLIRIQFEAVILTRAVDSIIFGTTCDVQSVAVLGSGGAADFIVTDQTWPNEPLGNCYPKVVDIENLSDGALTIDTAWWSDTVHFKPLSTFPVTIPASPAKVGFTIEYCPDSGSLTSRNHVGGNWYSPQVLRSDGSGSQQPRFDSLIGWAVAPSQTFAGDIDTTIYCATTNETVTAEFLITATGTAQTTIKRVHQTDSIDFFNLQGNLNINNLAWDPTQTAQQLDPGETATISVQYLVKAKQNDSVVDYITAFDGNDDTIGRSLKLTVISNYANGVTNPPEASIGPLLFQTPPSPGANSSTFVIQNTANSPLEIDTILLQPGLYDSAFSFAVEKVPPAGAITFPDTLPAGQSLQLTVFFNDSLFSVREQTVQFEIVTNSCSPITETVTATISDASVKEQIAPSLEATILPTEDGHSLEIVVPSAAIGPLHFELVNMLGESVQRALLGTGTQTLDESALPRGVYFYRLTSGTLAQSGKVILGE